MLDFRFGVAINCIDGRIQDPVSQWLRAAYSLDYIDVITEPGADHVLATQPEAAEQIRARVALSVQRHGSSVVAVTGHHDCAANPVSKEEHLEQVRKALQVIRFWNLPVTVLGLWINEQWQVEIVA